MAMNDETVRGYKAIQVTYALAAAHLGKDELGLDFLLPTNPLDCLDALESTLVACYLTLNELRDSCGYSKELTPALKNALLLVNSQDSQTGNKPLAAYLNGKSSKAYNAALIELTAEFAKIWEERWPVNNEALERAREVCAINMQFSLKN